MSSRQVSLISTLLDETLPGPIVVALQLAREATPRGLDDVVVVAHQHVQGSFVSLARALQALGLSGSSCTVIAKAYSSHPAAVEAVTRLGWSVVSPGRMENPCASYEVEALQTCIDVLGTVSAGSHVRRVLLLDEGGALSAAVKILRLDEHVRVFAVEQTTRGSRAVQDLSVTWPVIDVAGSNAKRTFEPGLIATSMKEGVSAATQAWAPLRRLVAEGLWTVLGYGAIGSALAARLPPPVLVVDSDPLRLEEARSHGYDVCPPDGWRLGRHRLVFGCIGGSTLAHAELLDIASVAFNGASSDIEFDAAAWRCNGDRLPSDLHGQPASDDRPWRNCYVFDGVYLPFGGFPANFRGQLDSVDRTSFSTVRALMLLGAVQALSAGAPGLQALDAGFQSQILGASRSDTA